MTIWFFPDGELDRTVGDALGRPLTQYARARTPTAKKPAFRANSSRCVRRKKVGEKLETQFQMPSDIFRLSTRCDGTADAMGGISRGSLGVWKIDDGMAMLRRHTDADVIVIGLIGERREVQQSSKGFGGRRRH